MNIPYLPLAKRIIEREVNYVVQALPGYGKSTLLVALIYMLIKIKEVKPNKVLFVCFETRFALEAASRLKDIGLKPKVYTLHAWGLAYLLKKTVWSKLGFTAEPSVLEESTARKLFDRVAKKVLKETVTDQFYQQYQEIANTPSMEQDISEDDEPIARIYRSFNQEKLRTNKVDYEDMSRLTLAGLRRGIGRPSYQYLLVDEGQDLTEAQVELCGYIARPTSQTIVVGDPLQRIYGFRFAPRDAMQQLKDLIEARGKVLNKSHRLHGGHTPFINLLLCHNGYKQEVTTDKDGPRPRMITYPSRRSMYLDVAVSIQDLLWQGVDPGSIVVLDSRNDPLNDFFQVITQLGILARLTSDKDEEVPEQQVQLSTINSAKGGTWSHVFILSVHDEPNSHDEDEFPVFFVANTRSDHQLTLCELLHEGYRSKRKTSYERSRFLQRIPDLESVVDLSTITKQKLDKLWKHVGRDHPVRKFLDSL